MRFVSRKRRTGFTTRPLHRRKEPLPLYYLSQRMTFWVAVVSVLAFVTGNMMGQHGWRVFWKSVLGENNDSLIVYTGTVPPVARVPDYARWSRYGGSAQAHLFTEVPQDILIPLPVYDSQKVKSGTEALYYSVGYMGAYASGGEGDGDHPGIDIRVPTGTPVQSVMNGIVTAVRDDGNGFGRLVVIRHPNVPDPQHPGKTTVLYSVYAHVSKQLVTEGETVRKGQEIALSGQTGDATGPHLHFQMDRDVGTDGVTVPFHPFWPFSSADAKAAGLTYTQAINSTIFQQRGFASTVNGMLYVQAQYPAVMTVVLGGGESSSAPKLTAAEIRAQRIQKRLAGRSVRVTTVAVAEPEPVVSSSSSAASVVPEVSASSSSGAPASTIAPVVTQKDFGGIEVVSPSSFTGRKWETISLQLLDKDGEPLSVSAFDGDLYLRTAYGKAEFRPSVLSPLDFTNGRATVQMLPLGHTTVIIQVQPLGIMGKPMKWSDR